MLVFASVVPCDNITTTLHVAGSMLRRLLLRWPSVVNKSTSCTFPPPATATPAAFDTISFSGNAEQLVEGTGVQLVDASTIIDADAMLVALAVIDVSSSTALFEQTVFVRFVRCVCCVRFVN